MGHLQSESSSGKGGTALWHPFAAMHSVRDNEFIVERGEDIWVFDSEGKRYLDATASLWYCNVGHGRREIADAVARQMHQLETYSIFGDYSNTPARELAARLSAYAPMADAKVFLTSGGGDSIDTAVKIALVYWDRRGEPERTHVISRTGAYHGTHGIGTGLAGIPANRRGFESVSLQSSLVDNNDAEALAREIERVGAHRVAAFILEPVIGAGGVILPEEGYLAAAADVCRSHGVLLVVDSVICGFGRLGSWFGIERWGVEPDMIAFAKGVTSGYLPLGGVVAAAEVARPFWDEAREAFRHGPTYAGHAACAAAAMANLDIMEREGLLDRAKDLESPFLCAMAELNSHKDVAEVRGGVGLLGAIEISPEALQRNPAFLAQVHEAARRRGVLIRPLMTSIALSPPLTIDPAHFGHIVDVVGEALTEVA